MRYAAAAFSLLALRLVAAKQIDVTVGGVKNGAVQLLFDPEAVFADAGDVVKFTFKAKNHTVTQGSFAGPCDAAPGGFDSGFHAATVDQVDGFDTMEFTVPNTNPLWFHCAAPGHCGKGMVFAINCGADDAPNSFANFKKAALAIGAAQGSSTAGAPPAATTTPIVYGTYTVPPEPSIETVTATISVESSMWTTTYASYEGSGDPAPSSLAGNVHVIKVGSNGLVFDPQFVQASPRDILRFEFHAKNHTVTQSSFANPCKKLDVSAETGAPGLDSGFMPVAADATTFPTWDVVVNTTAPLWFYCKQRVGNHCGSGMVFAANSDESGPRNFAAYKALATAINGTSAGSGAQPTGAPAAASPRATFGTSAAALALVAGAAALLL